MDLNKALSEIYATQSPAKDVNYLNKVDSRILLLVTLAYIIAILSIPLEKPDILIWFSIYPILMAPFSGVSYAYIFRRSLWVLPFLILLGIFNPLFDSRTTSLYNYSFSVGWITFLSIIIRGLLSFQALLILIRLTGFFEICKALKRLGIPKVLSNQLFLLYRYIGLILEEAIILRRSTISRGYGKKSFPLKIWVQLVGSLLLRSYERSKRIHNAMLSRGF